MTVKAKLILRFDKIFGVIARVWAVARRASPIRHRPMHVDLVELFFLIRMAHIAKSLDRRVEKRGVFRSMRVMASRALFGAEGVVY